MKEEKAEREKAEGRRQKAGGSKALVLAAYCFVPSAFSLSSPLIPCSS
jgi:hypothetical protein